MDYCNLTEYERTAVYNNQPEVTATTTPGTLPAGETRLMQAVFEDAILCFVGRARRRRVNPEILAREAEYWIRSEDWESPFSFNNVCTVLGLPPSNTRNTVLGWKPGHTFETGC